ncbi:MAG: hypothetical protein DVB31_00735 [Verrucomicrobia bacterium]|nr:MAG: hypothetical protein DVB31_00735 [Verrucomicrobiota bacterium]
MSSTAVRTAVPIAPMWKVVLATACAGGMAWGIRGQYGHETGAMIAGLLVSLVLVRLLAPMADGLAAARAVALGTIAMGFGGTETYGQTIGLTHDPELVGNVAALRWGMLGLAIKGGIWIGFCGVFLGMGLGGVRYPGREMFLLLLGILGLSALGIWWINQPYDPAHRVLPRIYFSDDWRWEPGAVLKPRREVWGGLALALLGVLAYAGAVRRDALAWRVGLWGILGGAVGFPLGQCLQAWHAWHRPWFANGPLAGIDRHVNWWNFMETTFGLVMGAALGAGFWLNRRRIRMPSPVPAGPPAIPAAFEAGLLALHGVLLAVCEFGSVGWVERLYDFGPALGVIPVALVVVGRGAAWWMALPITLLPIAGKTLVNLAYEERVVPVWLGWAIYVVVPLGVTVWLALRWTRNGPGRPAVDWLRPTLVTMAWLYFGLNLAFFRFPWPWAEWTARTPNALVFLACAIVVTLLAGRRRAGEG